MAANQPRLFPLLKRVTFICANCSTTFSVPAQVYQFLQVLWISDDGVPDLGGHREESTCFADEVRFK